ncbi:MAG: cupin domain-containing protein [Psychromonas sp.]
MTLKAFVIQPEQRSRVLRPLRDEKITVLVSKQETQGYEVFLQEGLPHSGPRLHSHDRDETFYVIEGDLSFTMNGEEQSAKEGTLVHFPAGTIHNFKFGENGGKMISITGQGSNASTLFTATDAENSKEQPSQEKLMSIIAMHGLHIPEENQ